VPPRRGKKLRNHLKNVERKLREAGPVSVKQAVAELKKLKRAKFDETVEIHINLGIDTTQSDQMVRGAIPLPHGIGKSVRVAVFAQGDNVNKAKAAGADIVGGADLVEKVQKENFLDFDVAIATQDMMAMVSRLGKVLGPRGLMPTPKAGTVVPATGDLAAAIKDFKAGKVEYRSDKTGQIHAGVGKMSFDDQKLVDNINVFVEQVRAAKPSGVKGNFINGVVISATMSPGIRVNI
jgi:large subunit ribosomal protein L1